MSIVITDSDIDDIETLLGCGIHFDVNRRNIIKNLNSMNVQAVPGSGKTTLLVAKLAILSSKWVFKNKGICVLSHTNVAKDEICNKLGASSAGIRLLNPPNFVGTLHSFFNTFVGIPWIRSLGGKITVIDDDIVLGQRVKELNGNGNYSKARYWLGNRRNTNIRDVLNSKNIYCNPNIELSDVSVSYKQLTQLIKESQRKGYFTYDEMLRIALDALRKTEAMKSAIRERFPFVFIDEYQDTNELQYQLISEVFSDADVCIQKYGDPNQAIFNNESKRDEANWGTEPIESITDSCRFASDIARFANCTAVSDLMIDEQDNAGKLPGCKHTIFIFDDDSIQKVKIAFAKLCLNTFSDDELNITDNQGIHVIGFKHHAIEEKEEKKFPQTLPDYYYSYEASHVKDTIGKMSILDYLDSFRCKQGCFDVHDFLDSFATMILQSYNGKSDEYIYYNSRPFKVLEENFDDDKYLRKRLSHYLMVKDNSDEDLDFVFTRFTQICETLLDLYWINEQTFIERNTSCRPSKNEYERNNIFHYEDRDTGRSIDLRFGSIHSVKGRTHLATLLVDTFYYKSHMKAVIESLCGESKRSSRYIYLYHKKLAYVAMTRARRLLCLAVHQKNINEEQIQILQSRGWNIDRV